MLDCSLWHKRLMKNLKEKKLHGRGGPGRGQGNKPIANKRVQISANIPPSMLERIKSRQKVTGGTLSSTIVWLIDHGLSATRSDDTFD